MISRRFSIYLITNRNLVSEEKYYKTIVEASKVGIDKIILREKDLNSHRYKQLYHNIKSLLCDDIELIVNSKIDVFNEVGGSTIHLPFKDFMELERVEGMVGVSIHSVEEAIMADKKGVTYVLASHIFETKCKEGLKPKGVEFIKNLRKNISCKIIALGGINTENYKEVINAGADGIAIMSLLFLNDNIKDIIKKFN
jgi:thiamine-phosphate pyrophosphorylase